MPVVPLSWIALFVSGYARRPQAVAGKGAVPPSSADRDQPQCAMHVGVANKSALADQLWELFATQGAANRAAAMNQLLTHHQIQPALDGEGQLRWHTPDTSAEDLLAAACVTSLTDAVRHYGWQRLGTCQGCDCVDVFIDQAGRTPRRYCTPTCLNRAKVRAYRARQSTPPVKFSGQESRNPTGSPCGTVGRGN